MLCIRLQNLLIFVLFYLILLLVLIQFSRTYMTLPPYPIHLGSTQPTASYGRLQNYQTGNAPTVAQHAQPSDEHAYAKSGNRLYRFQQLSR